MGEGIGDAGQASPLGCGDPGRRFDDLFNFVHDPATLREAYWRVAGNRGAEHARRGRQDRRRWSRSRIGVPEFLDGLRAQLKEGTFRPLPVRERKVPKPGGSGKLRKLGIPAVADKVIQAALKLVLEPIFKAGFKSASYGFRPRAEGTRRDRRDPPLRHPRLPLGAGRGYRGGI